MKRVILFFLMKSTNHHVENYVSDIFEEDFSMPLSSEGGDGYLDDSPQAKNCNNGLDHQEEEEDSKWDTYLCFLDSKITFLDSMEKHNDIFLETHIKNRVLNSDILDEEVDVSFENCQERSLHGFLEENFGRVLEEIQFEWPYRDRYIT